ncbi:MAG: helix-turn-helix domain-containing protein [Bacteroidota bacterium]
MQKDFKELRTEFFNAQNPDTIALLYASAYLQKATQLQDSQKITEGLYYKSLVQTDSVKLISLNSLIARSKKSPNHYLLEDALVAKAGYFFRLRLYKKALKLYTEAQKYAIEKENQQTLFMIRLNIGIINNLIGNSKEGLDIFKKSLTNYTKLGYTNKALRLNILANIANSYMQEGMYDSVTPYTTEIIKQTQGLPKYEELYNLLVLKQGINLYHQQAYTKAVDSIEKTIPYFQQIEDESNLGYAYFYLGKTHLATQHSAKAIDYFKKVDTIFLKVNYLFPETRATYELLIDHYKKKKDLKKQLVYIERLLQLDSILHDEELYLTKHISEDYNTPRLLADKQYVIASLEEKANFYIISIVIAMLLVIIAVGFVIYQYTQRTIYKKRFEQLLKTQETQQHSVIEVSDHKKSALQIPEDIVSTILENLEDFKQKNEFLSPNITLHKLAKRFKTNHTYLSKIINVYEGKSFNAFVNDLRITYTMNRLQKDIIFRKYTIDAIAEESGFSNTRTFSRAFQRKTNLNPSYFIKNLNASQTDI